MNAILKSFAALFKASAHILTDVSSKNGEFSFSFDVMYALFC